MKYEIVPIADEHIEGFTAVLDGVARERRYLSFLEAPPVDRVRRFVAGNQKLGLPHFVALVDGQVAGWCDVSSLDRPLYEHCGVLGLGVAAEFRGNGIGHALLRSVLESAKARGRLTRVELTVRENNLPALALYRKVGFRIEGIKHKAVRLDGEYENLVFMAMLF